MKFEWNAAKELANIKKHGWADLKRQNAFMTGLFLEELMIARIMASTDLSPQALQKKE